MNIEDKLEVRWISPSLYPGHPENPVSSKVVTISHLVDVIVRNSLTFSSLPYIEASDHSPFFFPY